MIETRECPLCGELMRIKTHEVVDRIPGQSQVVRREIREWVCAECDYYEEAEEPGPGAAQG
jgi:YgiT-type zinc finger domain-containing protein